MAAYTPFRISPVIHAFTVLVFYLNLGSIEIQA